MSRFDLYATKDRNTYLIDLQSNFLEHYNTRVVAPVVSAKTYDGAARDLNPTVQIEGAAFVVQTHLLATVPASLLRRHVGSLSGQADEITRGLDMLFQGY